MTRSPGGLFDALEGVDELLHAGDITWPDALIELQAIAPVTAVRGDCDGRISPAGCRRSD